MSMQNVFNMAQKSIVDAGYKDYGLLDSKNIKGTGYTNSFPVDNIPRTDLGNGPLASDNMYIQNIFNVTQKGVIDAGYSDFGSLESMGIKRTSYSNPKYDSLVPSLPVPAEKVPKLDWGNNLLETDSWQIPNSVKEYLAGGFQVGVTHNYLN